MNFVEIYQDTLPFITTGMFMMGATLWIVYSRDIYKTYRSGMHFMATAMFAMALSNALELIMGKVMDNNYCLTLSYAILSSSVELTLLYYGLTLLLEDRRISRWQLGKECALIVGFNLPAVLISPYGESLLFDVLAYLSLGYYTVRLIISIYYYERRFVECAYECRRRNDPKKRAVIDCVSKMFYVILVIAGLGIVIPFTNSMMMSCYQLLLMTVFGYLYYTLISQEKIFRCEPATIPPPKAAVVTRQPEAEEAVPQTETSGETMIKQWTEARYYTQASISPEDMARQLGVKKAVLMLYIDSEIQMSFYEWITKLRIEDAKRLLVEQPSLSISKIATDVGVNDRSNFDKTFKRLVGVSPASYRVAPFSSPASPTRKDF